MDKRKAINILDKVIQCEYLQYIDRCPDVACNECEYNHCNTSELIEAMKMALQVLEGDAE